MSIVDLYGIGRDLRLVDKMEAQVLPWVASGGDTNHRVNYPLTKQSLVFDIGGYMGDWVREIDNRYGCTIKVFEPVKSFVDGLKKEFEDKDNIMIYPYGLGGAKREEKINIDREASSIFKTNGAIETISIEDISKNVGSDIIDLMKMNIEGGEYEIINRLIETGQISQIKNIQIQFHDFIPKANKKRGDIQKELLKTHKLEYCYPFIWESWSIYE